MANWDQTMPEWPLGGVLFQNFVKCKIDQPTKTADISRLSFNIGPYVKKCFKNILLWNCLANRDQTLMEWSLGGPLSELCPMTPSCQPRWPPISQRTVFNIGPYRKNVLKMFFFETTSANWDHNVMPECFLCRHPFRIMSDDPIRQPRLSDINQHSFNIGRYGKNFLKIFSSETT